MKKIRIIVLATIAIMVLGLSACGKKDSFEKPKTDEDQPWKDETLGSLQFVVKKAWEVSKNSLISDGDGLVYKIADDESIAIYYVDWTAARTEAQNEENNGEEWSKFWSTMPWNDSIEERVSKYLTGKLSPATIKFEEDSYKTDAIKYIFYHGKASNVNQTYQAEMYYHQIDDYNMIAIAYLFGENDSHRSDVETVIKSISISK